MIHRAAALLLIVVAAALGACGGEDASPAIEPPVAEQPPAPAIESEAQAPADAEQGGQSPPTAAAEPGGEGQPSAPQAGGEEAVGGRPRSIEQVTGAVLTGSADPVSICAELVTEKFVRTAYGSAQGCLSAQQPGAAAAAVEVRDVVENGDTAGATAIPSGGPYDGIRLKVALVADSELEGAWRLDELIANIPAGP